MNSTVVTASCGNVRYFLLAEGRLLLDNGGQCDE